MARPDPDELRSRREERIENGVKNLKGARLILKTSSNNRIESTHTGIDLDFSLCYRFKVRLANKNKKNISSHVF